MQCALLSTEGETCLTRTDDSGRRYQTGRHLSAFLLLLVLQQPDHGGSLIERLRSLHATPWTVDSGRVYRLLREMEEEGALRSNWEQMDAGQPVRVYRITPLGEARLAQQAGEIQARRDALDRFLQMWRGSQRA